jgi:glycosyltransferase involved in cell wall biosynthesis
MVLISIISPIYGCSKYLEDLYDKLKSSLSVITEDYEIIFINDASPGDDWEKIKELAIRDRRIIGINLSRNFGQHYAISAGFEYSKGEWIVVMDGDLQDRPEEIIKFYNKAKEGYDIILGSRYNRNDNILKKCSSKIFYMCLSYLTETEQDSSIGNYGMYNRNVIKSIMKMGDKIRYFPTMVQWVGFKKTIVQIEHSPRINGKSSYTFLKLLRLALNIMLAFSEKPLRLTVKFGLFISLISFLFGLFTLYKYCVGDIKIIGWTSLVISIWFLSGLIIFLIGIVGIYVGKAFEQAKKRPLYIIKETINDKNT